MRTANSSDGKLRCSFTFSTLSLARANRVRKYSWDRVTELQDEKGVSARVAEIPGRTNAPVVLVHNETLLAVVLLHLQESTSG